MSSSIFLTHLLVLSECYTSKIKITTSTSLNRQVSQGYLLTINIATAGTHDSLCHCWKWLFNAWCTLTLINHLFSFMVFIQFFYEEFSWAHIIFRSGCAALAMLCFHSHILIFAKTCKVGDMIICAFASKFQHCLDFYHLLQVVWLVICELHFCGVKF